jgi:hypothetical protein
MTDYGPSIKAARLYERMPRSSNIYLAGRWGALRTTVIKSKYPGENGEPMRQVLLSEAPAKADGPDRVKKQESVVEPEGTSKGPPDASCSVNDPIPF